MTSGDKTEPKPDTLAARALEEIDGDDGAVVPALRPSTTFARDEAYRLIGDGGYARDASPSVRPVERLLARLELGEAALAFASGMAAASALVHALRPGDHVVAQKVMYWGLRRWLVSFCSDWGIELDLVDAADPQAVLATVKPGRTRLVWIETPCNPSWEIVDIAAAAESAHRVGAALVVDSTVATPVHTRPLELGADYVLHAATKYLNGHSDVVAGALVAADADTEIWHRVRGHRHDAGAILGAFEAWLLLRGLRTLYLRVYRQSESALRMARRFESHPKVTRVCYPGLESHVGHATASKQMDGGYGGMLSLCIAGGAHAALRVAGACKLFVRATSLGGVESLIEHRASIEDSQSAVPEDLLRLSVGIENVVDLIADLEQALEHA